MSSHSFLQCISAIYGFQFTEASKEGTKEDTFSMDAAQRLISSGKHKNLLQRTSLLQTTDLKSLLTTEQKICFYGNLLTLMGIHIWLHAIETGVSCVNAVCYPVMSVQFCEFQTYYPVFPIFPTFLTL